MFVAGWRHALRSEWPFIIIFYVRDVVFDQLVVNEQVKEALKS